MSQVYPWGSNTFRISTHQPCIDQAEFSFPLLVPLPLTYFRLLQLPHNLFSLCTCSRVCRHHTSSHHLLSILQVHIWCLCACGQMSTLSSCLPTVHCYCVECYCRSWHFISCRDPQEVLYSCATRSVTTQQVSGCLKVAIRASWNKYFSRTRGGPQSLHPSYGLYYIM